MKSFKKIALAMVAAMTLGTLVATPASANPMTVTVETYSGTAWGDPATVGTASTSAIKRPVPADNSVDAEDAIKFVANVATGTVVTVVATNAIIVEELAKPTAPVTASSGAATWNKNVGTGTTATFYIYTKTTAIGSVAITNGGTTLTYYVQGTMGKINSLAVAGVNEAAAGSAVTLTVTALDVFGNKVSGKGLSAIANGAVLDTVTALTGSALNNFGTAEFKFVAPTNGPVTVVVYVTNSADVEATTVGFNVPASSAVKIVAVRDLAAELAKSLADLAAEKAGRASDKAASDKAAVDAKVIADAAAAKAAADSATALAKITKLEADAVIAKLAADKAVADALAAANANADSAKAARAELELAKADNAKALADLKAAFNKLARQWNKANPKAKVALIK